MASLPIVSLFGFFCWTAATDGLFSENAVFSGLSADALIENPAGVVDADCRDATDTFLADK